MHALARLLAYGAIALALSLQPQEGTSVPLRPIATLVRHAQALPDAEIVRLAKLAERNGAKSVGEDLGKRALPEIVVADTYIRIAIHQGRVDRPEAQQMIDRLAGVPVVGLCGGRLLAEDRAGDGCVDSDDHRRYQGQQRHCLSLSVDLAPGQVTERPQKTDITVGFFVPGE